MKETTLFDQGKISRDEYMAILAQRMAENRTRQGINRMTTGINAPSAF